MKVAEIVKPILVAEDEAIMVEPPLDWLTDAGYQVDAATEGELALRAELSSWDEEGRAIAEQIITRFPRLFPYFSKH
jgi:CheY-like chemotaxis protein